MTVVWDYISSHGKRPKQPGPRYAIFHTNAAGNSVANLRASINNQLAAGNTGVTQPQGQFAHDGTLYRYLDDNEKAVASFQADGVSVSYESQDQGTNLDGSIENDPWTLPQIDAMVEEMRRLHRDYGIPYRYPVHPLTDTGFGYHSMWGYNKYGPGDGTYGHITESGTGRNIQLNNPWTKVVGKTCPGAARISQFPLILAKASEENTSEIDDMLRLIQDQAGVFVTTDFVAYRAVSPSDIVFFQNNNLVERLANGGAKVYDVNEEGLPADIRNRMIDQSPLAVQQRADYIVTKVLQGIPASGGITPAQIQAIVQGVLAGMPKNGTFTLG